MLLVSANVGPFKSISSPQDVKIDPRVTVLVGMNEAGKTAFLRALEKANDAFGLADYDLDDDYPRKDLNAYRRRHDSDPDAVAVLKFRLTPREVELVKGKFAVELAKDFEFTVTHRYDNTETPEFSVDEVAAISHLAGGFSTDAKKAVEGCARICDVPSALDAISLTEEDEKQLEKLKARIAKLPEGWDSVIEHELWGWLRARRPEFVYFGDYHILPSETNLRDLRARRDAAKKDPKQHKLTTEQRAVLALLRMADISLDDLVEKTAYEPMRAKLEAVSISLTDQIMAFWKANESNLEVMVDIKDDPTAEAPMNEGPNLYLRIRNLRHRGVSTPFRHRSRGFIWFFSFLVWFDSVQHQVDENSPNAPLILLLDEPGLSLHAMAQKDFLAYIDKLSEKHQVLYTTHSPFMVHSDRLHLVRVVEDKDNLGTVVSDNIGSSNDRTSFPLQAALGYTIAQNLFISERNLLVEGPSELLYVKAVSSMLERDGRTGLRDDVTIVPVGGLTNVVTFVALLGASGLKLAVLHDYNGQPDQKLTELVKEKLISKKAILDVSQFRDLQNIGTSGLHSDIEDLFEPAEYVASFNAAFAGKLQAAFDATTLPPRDRIVHRLEEALKARGDQLRPSGGFNHYIVASHFTSSSPQPQLAADTLSRFEELFKRVNSLF